MIGLVFGFFFAVCLLYFCIWVFGVVIEEPAILLWLLVPIGLIVIWVASLPDPPKQTYSYLNNCLRDAQAEYSRHTPTAHNNAYYARVRNHCYQLWK